MTPSEMNVQIKGLTAVAIILTAAAIVLMLFFKEMSTTSLMGASPKYKPTFPAVPVTDTTQAPQCLDGYDRKWVGCQKLAQ